MFDCDVGSYPDSGGRHNVVLRKRIIDRSLALEASTAIVVPTTVAGSLRLALVRAEQIEAQALQIETAKPAVAFVVPTVARTAEAKARARRGRRSVQHHFSTELLHIQSEPLPVLGNVFPLSVRYAVPPPATIEIMGRIWRLRCSGTIMFSRASVLMESILLCGVN